MDLVYSLSFDSTALHSTPKLDIDVEISMQSGVINSDILSSSTTPPFDIGG